jgi:hypothetical protein
MQRKKSRFIVFILSFIPGAGEMYMGFMQMGLSLMLGFMILTAIVGLTNLGALSVFPVALYAYSFFHANNLATLDDRSFHMIRDEFLFGFGNIGHRQWRLEGRNRTIAAAILIILGIMMLWQVVFNVLCDIFGWENVLLSKLYYFVRDELPRAVVGIAVIWGGLALIRGKRIRIEEEDFAAEDWSEREGQQPGQDGWRGSEGQQSGQDGWRGRDRQQPGQDGWPGREGQQPVQNGWAGQCGQPSADGRQTGCGQPPVMSGQMTVRDAQHAADGRGVYGEGSVTDGRIIYGEGPVADGRVIYGEGPVADGHNLHGDRPATEEGYVSQTSENRN